MTSVRPVHSSAAIAEAHGIDDDAPMSHATSRADRARAAERARLRAMVDEHFDAVFRALGRLGVPSSELEDCAQQVFWIASRKITAIAQGSERAFLLGAALRVAKDARRARDRRREIQDERSSERPDPAPTPDDLTDHKRLRALLDGVLAAMPDDLREVFVLFELEEMSAPQIAEILDIPAGTVASRLRRAREDFDRRVARISARGGAR